MRFLNCIIYAAVLGLLSHVIGEALPRRWFDPEKKPFAPWRIEKKGLLYKKLRVHKWKDKLPDMSRVMPGMVKKSISFGTVTASTVSKIAVETCVAEVIHDVLILCSTGIYLIWPEPIGAILSIVYALSNIPFAIIQRYNRPTLVLLSKRLIQREERLKKCES